MQTIAAAASQPRTSRFDRVSLPRPTLVRSRNTSAVAKAQRTARIDMLAIALALTAAALVRFNVIPHIGW